MELLDILTVLSFVIALENLSLNKQQVNNLEQHLQQQDDVLKEEQNEMLEEIITLLHKVLQLLKGE